MQEENKNLTKVLVYASAFFGAVIFFLNRHGLISFPASFMTDRYFTQIDFVGAIFTFLIIFWCLYVLQGVLKSYAPSFLGKLHEVVEDRAVLILSVFVVMLLIWYGLVLFSNPYRVGYNHGDAAFHSQILHNIYSGFGPEHTTNFKGNPYLKNNPYFFASLFSVSAYFLPIILLTPLYALYPHPPMQVFAVVIAVTLLGSFGVYLVIRAIGGSKTMSLLGALGYLIIPQMEIGITFKGYFDNLGFAVYPYVFAFLLSRKWGLFYLSLFILAIINVPYTYSAMLVGIITFLFFKARKQGIIAFLIGLVVNRYDMLIFNTSISGIWTELIPPPGFLKQFVLGLNFKDLSAPLLFNIGYIFVMFMTVSFLLFFAIRYTKKWNWQLIGMILFMLGGAVMGLLRSYGWTFQRNANVVVPIYISAFLAYASICRIGEDKENGEESGRGMRVPIGLILASGIISISLWTTLSLPWVGLNYNARNERVTLLTILKPLPYNGQAAQFLSGIDGIVSKEASIAYNIDRDLEAFLTNRRYAWLIGDHPEGAEYCIIQATDNHGWKIPWREELKKLEGDQNFRLIYKDKYREDDVYIYKNLNPKPIPRLESVLGWDILLKVLLPDNGDKKTVN